MLEELLDRVWLLGHPSVRVDRKNCDGASIRVLRDDLLHPYAGGNKLRKLDAWIPVMLEEGITDVVTCGGAQSAHAAAVASLAADVGLDAHVYLRGEPLKNPSGYNLVSHCFAEVTYVDRDRYANRDFLSAEAKQIEAKGKSVASIPEGAGGILSLYGLVRLVHGLMLAIEDPFSERLELVVDAGTGTTAAGLALGIALLELPWKVSAICLMQDELETYQSHARRLWTLWGEHEAAPNKQPEIIWNERMRPRRFGKVLEGEFDRCRIIARETGILLDPIYTLAAWDAIEQRKPKHRKNCLLVHTGGGLNLFGIANRYNIRFGGGQTD